MAGVQGSDFYYRVPSDPDTVLFLADENSGQTAVFGLLIGSN